MKRTIVVAVTLAAAALVLLAVPALAQGLGA